MTDPDTVRPVPDNSIIAYVLPGVKKDVTRSIRPCRPSRDWMDQTPGQYAYRCIPLSAANTMGWEILNPVDVRIRWRGKDAEDTIDVERARPDTFSPRPHFGSGTVTWYLPFLFRTPPDYGLAVAGPANHDKSHIVPLDAFVRTDWLPFPFTMNWRITTPDQWIEFAEGEPICRIFPYPLALLDTMQIELRDMDEDPAFKAQVAEWEAERAENYRRQKEAEAAWAAEGVKPTLKELWNSQYARGTGSDDAAVEHQPVFKCRPVVDRRD
ncbi:MAG: DUF6065 family protein [Pseudomonadota bacterium]